MLRHSFTRTSVLSPLTRATAVLQLATRYAYHKPTKHDWRDLWTRPLTQQEKVALNQQHNRTVSAVVPGEMFMRHWIVAQQSTLSVTNRVIGGIVAVLTMIWAAGYATLGYNGYNCAHVAGWMFIAYWLIMLEFHVLWAAPVVVVLGLAQLFLN